MKELIGKRGFDKSSFLQKIATGKTEIVGEIEIANEFNIVLQINVQNWSKKYHNHLDFSKVIWRVQL